MHSSTNKNSKCVFSRLRNIRIIMPPRRMLTVSQKLAILEEAEQTGSFKITARKHRLQKIQLIKWSASMEKLIEKRKLSRNALTTHKGPVVLNLEIELQVFDWVYSQSNQGFFVSTPNIITKMLK